MIGAMIAQATASRMTGQCSPNASEVRDARCNNYAMVFQVADEAKRR